MGREIESRHGGGRVVVKKTKLKVQWEKKLSESKRRIYLFSADTYTYIHVYTFGKHVYYILQGLN
jgi:hypothetical protein